MATRSAPSAVLLTAQLSALAVAVLALRANHSPEPPPPHPVLGATAPLLVYGAALLAAVLILVAAVRYRRAGRRATDRATPIRARRWQLAAGVALAVAVAAGAVLLLAVLSHRAAAPPQSTALPQPSSAPTTEPMSTVAPPAPTPPAPSASPTADLLPATFVVLPLLLALFAAGALLVRRRGEVPDDPPVSPPFAAPDPLTRATELGLQAVAAHHLSPGEAIVACYAAMEHALAQTPDVAPHASDTPTEVLARAVEHGALRPESAATLVELFAEARFSQHAITEAQRQAAADALQRVLDDLRSPACAPSL